MNSYFKGAFSFLYSSADKVAQRSSHGKNKNNEKKTKNLKRFDPKSAE